MPGIKVINNNAIKKKIINGNAFFAIFITGTSVKELATNKLIPIGGVTNPIAKLTTIIIPKCTGSKPTLFTIGNKIGV